MYTASPHTILQLKPLCYMPTLWTRTQRAKENQDLQASKVSLLHTHPHLTKDRASSVIYSPPVVRIHDSIYYQQLPVMP